MGDAIGAGRILSIVHDLCTSPIRSAIDLGCNCGLWLEALRAAGVDDLCGVDLEASFAGPVNKLGATFTAHDLAQPIRFGRRYDLALGLEVGEHIDGGDAAASEYVASLCAASDLVLFSAAAPRQGGHHHVNEQWPEYWASRFRSHGFAAADVIRPRVWTDRGVLWWYRQNTVIYFRRDSAAAGGLVRHECREVLPMIHPAAHFPRM